MPRPADVSFVIPVRNSAAALDRCLVSLRRAGASEIVVVDNGSSDDSVVVARRHGATVIERPSLRVGALRNEGVRHAAGAIVGFVDADHEVAETWTGACLDAFVPPDVGMAGRLCDAPVPGTWVQRAYESLRHLPAEPTDVEWLGAGNVAVRRDAFLEAHGFDESLEACEDVDLCRRLREAGWRLRSVPGMGSIHYGDPATLAAVFRGERWRGRNNLQVSLRERLTWRSAPGVLMPVLNMGAIVGMAAGLVFARWLGPWPACVCAAAIGTTVLLRTSVMVRRSRHAGLCQVLGCLSVAAAYELGRASAMALPGTHVTRQGAQRRA